MSPIRPSIRRGTLTRASNEERFYGIALVSKFLRRSGQQLQWRVVDDRAVTPEQTAEPSSVVGAFIAL